MVGGEDEAPRPGLAQEVPGRPQGSGAPARRPSGRCPSRRRCRSRRRGRRRAWPRDPVPQALDVAALDLGEGCRAGTLVPPTRSRIARRRCSGASTWNSPWAKAPRSCRRGSPAESAAIGEAARGVHADRGDRRQLGQPRPEVEATPLASLRASRSALGHLSSGGRRPGRRPSTRRRRWWPARTTTSSKSVRWRSAGAGTNPCARQSSEKSRAQASARRASDRAGRPRPPAAARARGGRPSLTWSQRCSEARWAPVDGGPAPLVALDRARERLGRELGPGGLERQPELRRPGARPSQAPRRVEPAGSSQNESPPRRPVA